jgi:predicted lipopolysaccharide heptosyltransferase III
MVEINGKKVLIVKLRYIGDTLSIIPVVENLKEKTADVTVDVLVNRGTEELVAHHPDIRKLWVYDRKIAKKNIFATLSYHKNIIKQLRSERYDFVIDFTHGDRAAFLSFMTGAPQRITYQNSSTLSHILMNRIIPSDPFQYHIVDFQLQSLRLLGLNDFNRKMTIHIPESWESQIDHLLSDAGIGDDIFRVAVHPGARGKLRRWPPERFAEIANRLRKSYQANILLIGGPGEDELVKTMEAHMEFPPSFISTRLSLLGIAALIKRCHLFIGNDSAPGHIAAAVNCPNLILFGPTFPHMWRPLSSVGEVVFKDVPCCGCLQKICMHPETFCMDQIEVDEVWEKVKKIVE